MGEVTITRMTLVGTIVVCILLGIAFGRTVIPLCKLCDSTSKAVTESTTKTQVSEGTVFVNTAAPTWNLQYYNHTECKERAWFITERINDTCVDGVNIIVCRNSTVVSEGEKRCEGDII